MIFSNAAESQISLYEEGGKIKAVMIGETKGFVGFLTSYVKHIYRSTFELVDNGTRLKTSTFEREVIIEDNREHIIHAMDYHSMRHHYFRYENDKLVQQHNDPIGEDEVLDDVLASFYNFRNGVYGKVNDPHLRKVPTFWTKKKKTGWNTTMTIQPILGDERKDFEGNKEVLPGAAMLMLIKFPSDLFETEKGESYFWASKHLVPTQAICKDFILFGDLHVRLRERISRKDKRTSISGLN